MPAERLNLKAGEWVEVRSAKEILATLDQKSCLEAMPFMPEMARLCGQKFRVSKRADKTCDPGNAPPWSLRRVTDSVHLQGVRCDGAGHGGCQAGCLIFWKEAWLKRCSAGDPIVSLGPVESARPHKSADSLVPVEKIEAASRRTTTDGEVAYFCQGTEVRNFTSFMKWWDIRQDIREIRSGNLSSGLPCNSSRERFLDLALAVLQVIRAFLIYRGWAHYGVRYPAVDGTLDKTPLEVLDLQPGELVQVRSKEEIVATLDKNNKNRGLLFDTEQVPYCGGIYRVLRRVTRIVDEKSGKMVQMKHPCIVLEGVVCKSDFHRLCPRAIYSYWRENWLRRVSDAPRSVAGQESEATSFQQY